MERTEQNINAQRDHWDAVKRSDALISVLDVEKERSVTQSCPTHCDPMACSLPVSPVHGILQNTGVGCHFLLQEIFSTLGSNLGQWRAKKFPKLMEDINQQIQCQVTPKQEKRAKENHTYAYLKLQKPDTKRISYKSLDKN